MQNTKKEPHYPFTFDHQIQAATQSCSPANTALASLVPAHIPGYQTHHSVHCCIDTLPLCPPILPEWGLFVEGG